MAAGLALAAFGLAKCLTSDAMTYSNYFGGQVYAPFVVLGGLIVAAGGLLGREPRPLMDRRGRALRLPADEHDRPWRGYGG